MKTDWRCLAVIAVALVLGASLLAPLADARGGGGARTGGFGGSTAGDRSPGRAREASITAAYLTTAAWPGMTMTWPAGTATGTTGAAEAPCMATIIPWRTRCTFLQTMAAATQGACYQACVSSGQSFPPGAGRCAILPMLFFLFPGLFCRAMAFLSVLSHAMAVHYQALFAVWRSGFNCRF